MKWNWGTGIVFSFVIFCGIIIAAVVRSFQEDVNLVTTEYYKEELAYQQRIDQTANVARDNSVITFDAEGAEIVVGFVGQGNLSGEIHLYRPDNPKMDQHIAIESRKMSIAKSQLSRGRWKVKISWKDSGKEYYKEEAIFI